MVFAFYEMQYKANRAREDETVKSWKTIQADLQEKSSNADGSYMTIDYAEVQMLRLTDKLDIPFYVGNVAL